MDPTRVAVTLPDSELAAALQRGEPRAVEALYDRYGRLAFGLASRMIMDRAAAEDVVQDAFISVWRNASTYDPSRGSLRGWLLSIVHHRAIDQLRGSAGRRSEAPLDAMERLTPDAFAVESADADRIEIRNGLAALPEAQRLTLELAYFGGLTHVEIALRMGVPLGTVKGRMRMGLEKLRNYLQEKRIEL
jgi:RNA polymerase sigma-70 factor (ECF subfamily)